MLPACAALIGCGNSASSTPAELPTLRELGPTPSPATLGPGQKPTETPAGPLIVQKQIHARHDGRVDLALQMLEPAAMPKALRERWKANGLHLGSIAREDLSLLMANLPAPLAVETITVLPGPHYAPITLVGKLTEPQAVRVVGTDGEARVERFWHGEHRLMLKLAPSMLTEEPARLDLLPHHYGPRATVVPRPPQQRMMDGTSFDALRVYEPVPEGRVWVIWSDVPPPPNEAKRPRDADKPTTAEPEDESEAGEATDAPVTADEAADEAAEAPAQPVQEGVAGSGASAKGAAAETGDGADEQTASGKAPATGEASAATRSTRSDPPRLGEAMMTGVFNRRPVRLLVILAPSR
jgi:hypothetical protein